MTTISEAVDTALAKTPLIGVEVISATANGVIHHSAHGDASKGATYRIFSMTKLVGALIALKAVEEGAFAWDDPAGALVPEFDEIPVIDGFKDDVPQLRPQITRATMMDLATHSSGAAYAEWCAPVRAYCRHAGIAGLDDASLAGLTSLPLAFDPGRGWAYGTGIDWLGIAAQRAMGERLQSLVPRKIFEPLGIDDLTFSPSEAQRSRLIPSHHLREGVLSSLTMEPREDGDHAPMGSALYGDGPAYIRLLQMILRGGEGVLSEASVDALFPARTNVLPQMLSQSKAATADVDMFPGQPATFALGGIRAEEDIPGKRREGAIGWAGMLNTHFWVDRQAGVAGVVMMQHLPFAEENAMSIYDVFEKAVYAQL